MQSLVESSHVAGQLTLLDLHIVLTTGQARFPALLF